MVASNALTWLPNGLRVGYLQDDSGGTNVLSQSVVADGTTDNTTALQAVFTAASAGDIIVFPPGTYKADQVTMTGVNDVTVVGYGATLYSDSGTADSWAMEFDDCDRIKVFGFNVDQSNNATASKQNGFLFRQCDGVEVAYNHFTDVWEGVRLEADTGDTVACSNVSVHHNTTASPTFTRPAWVLFQTFNVLVATENLDGDSIWTTGINVSDNLVTKGRVAYLTHVRQAVVADNISNESLDSVIYLDNDVQHFTVTGNIVYKGGKESIKIQQAQQGDGVMVGNYVYGAGDATDEGVTLYVIHDSKNVTFSGNTGVFSDNSESQNGLVMYDVDNINVNGNTFNGADTTAVNNADGIVVRNAGTLGDGNSTNIIIANNIFNTMPGQGIILQSESTYTISGVRIEGNHIHGDDTATEAYGIWLRNDAAGSTITDVTVRGNTITNWTTRGINVSGNGNDGAVSNIDINDNNFHDPDGNNACIRIEDDVTYSGDNFIRYNRSDGGALDMIVFEDAADKATWIIRENFDEEVEIGGQYPACFTASTPQTLVTDTDLVVALDTEQEDPESGFSVSASVITCANAGTYLVSYMAVINQETTSGDTFGAYHSKVEVNSGGGYADVPQSYSGTWLREGVTGVCRDNMGSTFVTSFAAGDLIRLILREEVSTLDTDTNPGSALAQISFVKVGE